jgi:hypothetical protein
MNLQAALLKQKIAKIGPTILRFCQARVATNPYFHMEELHAYVEAQLQIAPASPDRVLRALRQDGDINYVVVDRRASHYCLLPLQPDRQENEVGMDIGTLIKQVREVEDTITKEQAALDLKLAGHHTFVEQARAALLAFLNSTNQKSANTEFGGCHWKPKITYRVEDKDAFRRHVIGAEAWELITWAAGAVNCEAFTTEHKMPPPGLVRNAVNILYVTPPVKPRGKNKIVTP